MTINPTAWILLAMYVALAESRGLDLNRLSGTVQADILKEYIAQKEWIFPTRPSMRLMRDMIAFAAERMARYNPVNISGYHISEAGANAVQEVAFTMANGIAYVEEVTRAGVPVDAFASRLAVLLHRPSGLLRGGRQVPRRAPDLGEDHEASGSARRSSRSRCGSGSTARRRPRRLTKAQPMVNVVRTAFQALSAVLGGAQSLHTNGLDEAYAIPSEEAMKLALRTQQVVAEETGVAGRHRPAGRLLLRGGAHQPDRGRRHRQSSARSTPWAGRFARSRRATSSARSPTTPTRSPGARRQASSP